jgi:hypothetical protein
MKKYDALKEPDPREWLELDEQERVGLIADYHRRKRVDLPSRMMHAVFHAAVENQLTEGMPVVRETLSRLMREGLDRHEAIHAIGSALAECVWGTLRRDSSADDPNEVYLRALRDLTLAGWLKKAR